MGYSSWSDEAFRSVSRHRASAPSHEIFASKQTVDPLMDPRTIHRRESRDSEHHPNSVPIIVAFDVTGSMGYIPTAFAKEHLGTLMTKLIEDGWVTDPQVLFAAIGDAVCDRAPLQVGQFESGLEMDLWLTRIWLEGQGGDAPESYTLAHWFAAHRTVTDAWEKRGKKGYLFTIGDAVNKELKPAHLARVFGGKPTEPCRDHDVIAAASARWDLWHVLVRPDGQGSETAKAWRELLGRRVLVLRDPGGICDLLGVVMGIREGNLSLAQGRNQLVQANVNPADIESTLEAAAG